MNNLIYINDNKQATTTSKIVAEVFDKSHKEVLKSIRNLNLPKEFDRRNFALISYTDKNNRKKPCYEITKDGFVLLAMGFTGKKAMEFKIKYIEAFNEMEKRLHSDLLEQSILSSPDLALIGGTVKRCVKSALREINPVTEFDTWQKVIASVIDIRCRALVEDKINQEKVRLIEVLKSA